MPALTTSSGFGLNLPTPSQFQPLQVRPQTFVNGADFAGKFDTSALPSGMQAGLAFAKPLADAIMGIADKADKQDLLEKGQLANKKALDDAIAAGDQVEAQTDEMGNISFRRKPLSDLDKENNEVKKQQNKIELEAMKWQNENAPAVFAQKSKKLDTEGKEIEARLADTNAKLAAIEFDKTMLPEQQAQARQKLMNDNEKLKVDRAKNANDAEELRQTAEYARKYGNGGSGGQDILDENGKPTGLVRVTTRDSKGVHESIHTKPASSSGAKPISPVQLESINAKKQVADLAKDAAAKFAALKNAGAILGPYDEWKQRKFGGSPEANAAYQAYDATKNQILRARSGGAVTPTEAERMLQEIGDPSQWAEGRFLQQLGNFADQQQGQYVNLVDSLKESGYNVPESLKGAPRAGAGAPAEAAPKQVGGGYPEIHSKGEWAKLPTGTKYKDSFGKILTKK